MQVLFKKKYFHFGLFFIIWMIFFDTNSLLVHYNLLKEIENMETEKIYIINIINKEMKLYKNICTKNSIIIK